MISHAEFARLRLSDYVDDVSLLDCWEFMGRQWLGEAVGFSEWLRPLDDVERLGSLSLDFDDLPTGVSDAILSRLQLGLEPGMTLEDIRARIGEPQSTETFVQDRTSYEFRVAEGDPYSVSCTVHRDSGLIYLVVMTLGLKDAA